MRWDQEMMLRPLFSSPARRVVSIGIDASIREEWKDVAEAELSRIWRSYGIGETVGREVKSVPFGDAAGHEECCCGR